MTPTRSQVYAIVFLTRDPNKGIVRSLGFLPGGDSSEARDINNLDHVTGWATVPGGAQHVFLWKRRDGMSDLGTPEGTFRAFAEAINDQDEIVGEADLGSFEKLFYWSRSTGYRILQTLGAVGGYTLDINNAGVIVGSCQVPDTSLFHVVLWPDSLSAPQDLGTLPGGTIAYAFGINNLGQVVGQSDLNTNTDRR
jgi:probable HAF family extracellular repeat protein